MAFNPDSYLQSRPGFDPDKFLGTPVEPLVDEVGTAEAVAIGAGTGLTDVMRGVGAGGILPQLGDEQQAYQQLAEEQPIATTVGEIGGETAPFLIPGLGG